MVNITRYYGAVQDLDAIREISIDCYPEDAPERAILMAKNNPTWLLFDQGIQACLISEIDRNLPYLWSVATRTAHRGKGYATLLIKEFEKYYIACGYQKSWLHVRTDNPAQKLYFDLGYRVASFEKNIYEPGDGITMVKRLI